MGYKKDMQDMKLERTQKDWGVKSGLGWRVLSAEVAWESGARDERKVS